MLTVVYPADPPSQEAITFVLMLGSILLASFDPLLDLSSRFNERKRLEMLTGLSR